MGSMMGGAGMAWAMVVMMGASTLLLLALVVLTVLGVVWLARHLGGHGSPGDAGPTAPPPHQT
jgi:hypothetical protein